MGCGSSQPTADMSLAPDATTLSSRAIVGMEQTQFARRPSDGMTAEWQRLLTTPRGAASLDDASLLQIGRLYLRDTTMQAIVVLVLDRESHSLRVLTQKDRAAVKWCSLQVSEAQLAAAPALDLNSPEESRKAVRVDGTAVAKVPAADARSGLAAVSALMPRWEAFAESLQLIRDQLNMAMDENSTLDARIKSLQLQLDASQCAHDEAVANADALASRCTALEDTVRRCMDERDHAKAEADMAKDETNVVREEGDMAIQAAIAAANADAETLKAAWLSQRGELKDRAERAERLGDHAIAAQKSAEEDRARIEKQLREAVGSLAVAELRLISLEAERNSKIAQHVAHIADQDAVIAALRDQLAESSALVSREKKGRADELAQLQAECEAKLATAKGDADRRAAADEKRAADRLAESEKRAAAKLAASENEANARIAATESTATELVKGAEKRAAEAKAAAEAEVEAAHKALEDFTHNYTSNIAELAIAAQDAKSHGENKADQLRATHDAEKAEFMATLRAELEAENARKLKDANTELLARYTQHETDTHEQVEARDDEIRRLRENLYSVGEVLKSEVEKGGMLEKQLEAKRLELATARKQLVANNSHGGVQSMGVGATVEVPIEAARSPALSPGAVKAKATMFGALSLASLGRFAPSDTSTPPST